MRKFPAKNALPFPRNKSVVGIQRGLLSDWEALLGNFNGFHRFFSRLNFKLCHLGGGGGGGGGAVLLWLSTSITLSLCIEILLYCLAHFICLQPRILIALPLIVSHSLHSIIIIIITTIIIIIIIIITINLYYYSLSLLLLLLLLSLFLLYYHYYLSILLLFTVVIY